MKPGDRVICTNDKFERVSIDQGIRADGIYTVRWRGPYTHYVDGTYDGIKLKEVHRGNDDGPESYGAADMPFRAGRFRPVVTRKVGSKTRVEETV